MLALSMMMGGRATFDITIGSNGGTWQRTVDAPQVLNTAPVLLILRITSAIERQSASTSIAALVIDSLADGSEVQIINQGHLIGDGGNGGGGGVPFGSGSAGSVGGPAIRADFTGSLVLTNNLGRIWGGGGGGGGGAGDDTSRGGGGGGGGAGGGNGGAGAVVGGVNGSAGTTGSAGVGGAGGAGGNGNAGDGGQGQNYGVAGTNGANGFGGSGGFGGAAGKAIHHNAGTVVSFISGQTNPNVKGAIST